MNQEHVAKICLAFSDRGLLIEAGFAALQYTVIATDAGPDQIREMRMAFFAGAQHLFGSILSILEPGAEPTDNDIHRLTLIQAELDAFLDEFRKEHHL